MALTISEFVLEKQYDDAQIPSEAIFDAALQNLDPGGGVGPGIVYNLNTLRLNLLQLALEAHGTSGDPTFDRDGSANYTNTLYNKQSGVNTYSGGDIDLGTSLTSMLDTDGSNARIQFTPERPGDYLVTCIFTHFFVFNTTSEGQCEVSFRLNDGSSSSPQIRSGGLFPATASNAIRGFFSHTLKAKFTWNVTSQRTVTLQDKVEAISNVASNSVAASSTNGVVWFEVEKI